MEPEFTRADGKARTCRRWELWQGRRGPAFARSYGAAAGEEEEEKEEEEDLRASKSRQPLSERREGGEVQPLHLVTLRVEVFEAAEFVYVGLHLGGRAGGRAASSENEFSWQGKQVG